MVAKICIEKMMNKIFNYIDTSLKLTNDLYLFYYVSKSMKTYCLKYEGDTSSYFCALFFGS